MAEGFQLTPDLTEQSEKPATKAPETGRFKLFLQELFSEKSAEKKEAEEDVEKNKDKKSRFARAWRILFSSVAQKETVDSAPAASATGLFFERGIVTDAAEHIDHAEQAVVEAQPEQTAAAEAVETPQAPLAEAAPERPRTVVYERQPDTVMPSAEAVAAPEAAPAPQPQIIERSAAPERVVYSPNTTERIRQARIERRQKDIERDVKNVNREQQRSPEIAKTPERVPQPIQQTTEVIKTKEVIKNIETLKSVEEPATKQDTIERIVQQNPNQQPKPEQKRVAEQLLHAEIKEVNDESKDIAYELSHEHKDMDKQSAGAWAALQASADAQAKVNAAAIAAAQAAPFKAANDQTEDLVQARQSVVYKKAITGGFVTAIVIIAVLIVLFLIQSR